MSLDGVIDAPTWTFDYGFDPAMGQDIGNLMSSCETILWDATPSSAAVGSPPVPYRALSC